MGKAATFIPISARYLLFLIKVTEENARHEVHHGRERAPHHTPQAMWRWLPRDSLGVMGLLDLVHFQRFLISVGEL